MSGDSKRSTVGYRLDIILQTMIQRHHWNVDASSSVKEISLAFARWPLALFAGLVLASGCTTTEYSRELSFIKDGATSKQEVFRNLGMPTDELIRSKTFWEYSFLEKMKHTSRSLSPAQTLVPDQLYVYYLQSDSHGHFRTASITIDDVDGGAHRQRHDDLVLEFDPATGILKRHSLVTVAR